MAQCRASLESREPGSRGDSLCTWAGRYTIINELEILAIETRTRNSRNLPAPF